MGLRSTRREVLIGVSTVAFWSICQPVIFVLKLAWSLVLGDGAVSGADFPSRHGTQVLMHGEDAERLHEITCLAPHST